MHLIVTIEVQVAVRSWPSKPEHSEGRLDQLVLAHERIRRIAILMRPVRSAGQRARPLELCELVAPGHLSAREGGRANFLAKRDCSWIGQLEHHRAAVGSQDTIQDPRKLIDGAKPIRVFRDNQAREIGR